MWRVNSLSIAGFFQPDTGQGQCISCDKLSGDYYQVCVVFGSGLVVLRSYRANSDASAISTALCEHTWRHALLADEVCT